MGEMANRASVWDGTREDLQVMKFSETYQNRKSTVRVPFAALPPFASPVAWART